MEVILDCPLGHTCERIVDNKLHRCRWYREVTGRNALTGEEINRTWDCVVVWEHVMTSDVGSRLIGVQQATESLRNLVADQTQVVISRSELLNQARNRKLSSGEPA